ncbi:MAG: DUF192 domain-containing protein [Candidatus Omnitrophota bacterium]
MRTIILTVLLLWSGRVFAADELREVCSGEKCFHSEVVTTPEGRARGLMGRGSLADDEAMLFVFDSPGDYPFWMKNMNFAIDMIWLDDNKRVVHLETAVPACKKDPCPVYDPKEPARYVIELNAGVAQEAGIQPGDLFSWD